MMYQNKPEICKGLFYSTQKLIAFIDKEFLTKELSEYKEYHIEFNSQPHENRYSIHLTAIFDPNAEFEFSYEVTFLDVFGHPVQLNGITKLLERKFIEDLQFDILTHIFSS